MVLVATQVKRRRGTTAENDAFTGAEGEIVVDIERHELRVHDGVTQGGFKIGGAGGAMPVGAIFTTPRTGTIEGAVEANGGSYNIADYSGDGSIGALLTAGSIAYVSKSEFQTQVTNTGACDSFGWDGASDTTFLVPKLKPWHVGKNAPVVGNGMTLGLTNSSTNTSLQAGDNGIMYWGKKGDFITHSNILAVIRDGAVATGMVYAEKDETGVYSHSYFIKLKNYDVSFEVNLYLSCILTKTIYPKYTRDDTCIWERIQEDEILLPVSSNNEPDWEYMENYMKNIMQDTQSKLDKLVCC